MGPSVPGCVGGGLERGGRGERAPAAAPGRPPAPPARQSSPRASRGGGARTLCCSVSRTPSDGVRAHASDPPSSPVKLRGPGNQTTIPASSTSPVAGSRSRRVLSRRGVGRSAPPSSAPRAAPASGPLPGGSSVSPPDPRSVVAGPPDPPAAHDRHRGAPSGGGGREDGRPRPSLLPPSPSSGRDPDQGARRRGRAAAAPPRARPPQPRGGPSAEQPGAQGGAGPREHAGVKPAAYWRLPGRRRGPSPTASLPLPPRAPPGPGPAGEGVLFFCLSADTAEMLARPRMLGGVRDGFRRGSTIDLRPPRPDGRVWAFATDSRTQLLLQRNQRR